MEIVNEEYVNAMRAFVVNWRYKGKPDGFTLHQNKLSAQLYASYLRREEPELEPTIRPARIHKPIADLLEARLGAELAVFGVGERFDDEWLREEHLPVAA